MTTTEEPGTDIVAAVTKDPSLPLLKPLTFEDLYKHIKAEADALEIELTTEAGRKRIRSMAFKIARTKTAIDDAGKKLNEEARAKINAVDAERRKVRERLDALRDEVRKPLTEWESAEEDRQNRVTHFREWMIGAAVVLAGDTDEMLTERLEKTRAIEITTEKFGADAAALAEQRTQAITTLETAIKNTRTRDAERAELERLRREKEDREGQDKKASVQKSNAERALSHIARLARIEPEGEERLSYVALLRRRKAFALEFDLLTDDEYGPYIDRIREACQESGRKLGEAIESMRAEAEREAREAEEARRQRISERTMYYARSAVVREDDTLESLSVRRDEINTPDITSDLFGDDAPEINRLRMDAQRVLNVAIDRKAAERREAEEAEKRRQGRAHREKVHEEIAVAIKAEVNDAAECDLCSDDMARLIVAAITVGKISHVTITY